MKVHLVIQREFNFFKKRYIKITVAALISPLLYLIAFGWGLGKSVTLNSRPYMDFVLPGIIALTGMYTSYSAIALRVNTMRVHEHSFEYFLVAPIRITDLVFGHLVAGMFRGMYAVILIIISTMLFGIPIPITPAFIGICILNTAVFASLGYFAAVTIDNHYDMNNFSSFVITPMVFLCSTFFSLESLPGILRQSISYLPLSQVSNSLRCIVYGSPVSPFSYLILTSYLLVFIIAGMKMSKKDMV